MDCHFLFRSKMTNFVAQYQFLKDMKGFNTLVAFLMVIYCCKGQNQQSGIKEGTEVAPTFSPFGEKIDAMGALDTAEMTKTYARLEQGDTLRTKFTAVVTDVCRAKGCWMKLQLQDGGETMVRFKDYGFFMPRDIAGREVIVNGLAFVAEMGVEDQRHYAKDGGKSAAEISKIARPKKIFGFEADGVLLKQ